MTVTPMADHGGEHGDAHGPSHANGSGGAEEEQHQDASAPADVNPDPQGAPKMHQEGEDAAGMPQQTSRRESKQDNQAESSPTPNSNGGDQDVDPDSASSVSQDGAGAPAGGSAEADAGGLDDTAKHTSRDHLLTAKPFQMPSDDDLFVLREQDREWKRLERQRNQNIKVQEKTTFSSRMGRTCPSDQKSMSTVVGAGNDGALTMTTAGMSRMGMPSHGGTLASGPGHDHTGAVAPMATAASEAAASGSLAVMQRTRLERENMSDFIAKKREIFLVQMSLDTKRTEIRKLEERALQREDALLRSEQMLEEDKLRFEEFLREKDEKVKEAIGKAEIETKAKQEKVNEIKRLNAAIASLRSELNKYEEQLEDCRKYKQFLDYLTPREWFEEQEEKRKELIKNRQKAFAEKLAGWEDDQKRAEEAVKAAELALEASNTQQEVDVNEEALKKATEDFGLVKKIPKPTKPASFLTDEEEEQFSSEMYFKHPQTLLDIFAQLEEQNLFLIQNCQETEEALEDLKAKYRETRQQMDVEIQGLDNQIDALDGSIKLEEEKSRLLREKADARESRGLNANPNANGANTGNANSGHGGASLEELSAKVIDVYNRSGFDNDASMSTLQMLTNIEAKLDEYFSIIETMPQDFVETAEKAKEKERRQRAREEKLEQQKREQERRVQRSLERAQAPVQKKTGKPVMFRSHVTKKKKAGSEVVKKNDEEAELEAFLQRVA